MIVIKSTVPVGLSVKYDERYKDRKTHENELGKVFLCRSNLYRDIFILKQKSDELSRMKAITKRKSWHGG